MKTMIVPAHELEVGDIMLVGSFERKITDLTRGLFGNEVLVKFNNVHQWRNFPASKSMIIKQR